jgi:hypothetical protein
MGIRDHAPKRPWRPRCHWQFTQAFGVKRSYTWITAKGMEAAERRLENHVSFLSKLSPEALDRVLSYDGPWTAAPPVRKDLRAG